MSHATHGLILIAHGARDPNWALPFEQTAARVRALRPGQRVALAYLEFMPPNLVGCGREMVAAGCTEVDVLPMFLGAGGHVRKDLPRDLAMLQAEFPQVRWQLQRAVGESPALVEAMAQIASGILAGTAPPLVDPSSTPPHTSP